MQWKSPFSLVKKTGSYERNIGIFIVIMRDFAFEPVLNGAKRVILVGCSSGCLHQLYQHY